MSDINNGDELFFAKGESQHLSLYNGINDVCAEYAESGMSDAEIHGVVSIFLGEMTKALFPEKSAGEHADIVRLVVNANLTKDYA